jgi:hypothetical protein
MTSNADLSVAVASLQEAAKATGNEEKKGLAVGLKASMHLSRGESQLAYQSYVKALRQARELGND